MGVDGDSEREAAHPLGFVPTQPTAIYVITLPSCLSPKYLSSEPSRDISTILSSNGLQGKTSHFLYNIDLLRDEFGDNTTELNSIADSGAGTTELNQIGDPGASNTKFNCIADSGTNTAELNCSVVSRETTRASAILSCQLLPIGSAVAGRLSQPMSLQWPCGLPHPWFMAATSNARSTQS